ncbi:RES family NAD+ phosphorylase [Paraburkholderia sp. CNPSo 3274]|uniref:RES family NAD+ phosphorylase n=1 Tax=Paraburkholderia sp. CNPSo 3274 TaxID=2940932 RepID=UPI0020B68351|nr:RES family NAD+ phosphorylase [Paraburkholderia sp. CNPSo 3274]MCP3711322.1 RES family NAD+ phosphorylase [Paraburkholderia sp. CNPSo 3274]
MMEFWRISNYADLRGIGGLRASGRWHYRGQPVVYLAENPALALLETMVHHEFGSPQALPENYQLLRVEIAEGAAIAELTASVIPDDWRENPDWTQAAGSEWLAAGQELLLKVPSAILPHSYNYLFNPAHPGAGSAVVAEVLKVPYDPRIQAILGDT